MMKQLCFCALLGLACNDTDANLQLGEPDAPNGLVCPAPDLSGILEECRKSCTPIERKEPGEQCMPGVTECTPGFFCHPTTKYGSYCTTVCDPRGHGHSDNCPEGMRCNPKGLCR